MRKEDDITKKRSHVQRILFKDTEDYKWNVLRFWSQVHLSSGEVTRMLLWEEALYQELVTFIIINIGVNLFKSTITWIIRRTALIILKNGKIWDFSIFCSNQKIYPQKHPHARYPENMSKIYQTSNTSDCSHCYIWW